MTAPLYLYRLLYPLALTVVRVLGLLGHRKIARGLELRAAKNGVLPWLAVPAGMEPIWIHCASYEFEYAKPVIRALRAERPELKIMVTYFSPSVEGQLKSFKDIDFYTPLPWDCPKTFRNFLTHHRPRVLLIARTDTWPEMLYQTERRGIPSLLFSTTLTSTSGRLRPLARILTKWVLERLSAIACVSEADAQTLRSLKIKTPIQVSGDTRYDQVIYRLANPKPLPDLLESLRLPVFIAGSTWPEDEDVLLPVIEKMAQRVQFILVPHEPSEANLRRLEDQLRGRNLGFSRLSALATWHAPEILLVDQLGILAELYLHAPFAFVGGSFRKTVHSVMEPLAAGCLTFVGPKHQNNREALEFKTIALENSLTAVECVENSADFIARLERALSADLGGLREQIRAHVTARAGKSRSIVEWTLAHLKS